MDFELLEDLLSAVKNDAAGLNRTFYDLCEHFADVAEIKAARVKLIETIKAAEIAAEMIDKFIEAEA